MNLLAQSNLGTLLLSLDRKTYTASHGHHTDTNSGMDLPLWDQYCLINKPRMRPPNNLAREMVKSRFELVVQNGFLNPI